MTVLLVRGADFPPPLEDWPPVRGLADVLPDPEQRPALGPVATASLLPAEIPLLQVECILSAPRTEDWLFEAIKPPLLDPALLLAPRYEKALGSARTALVALQQQDQGTSLQALSVRVRTVLDEEQSLLHLLRAFRSALLHG